MSKQQKSQKRVRALSCMRTKNISSISNFVENISFFLSISSWDHLDKLYASLNDGRGENINFSSNVECSRSKTFSIKNEIYIRNRHREHHRLVRKLTRVCHREWMEMYVRNKTPPPQTKRLWWTIDRRMKLTVEV